MTAHDRKGVANMAAALINAATRRLDLMFPGYFDGAKHNHYADFGWPTTLTFDQLNQMYERNALARAAVVKTARKVWETAPVLRYREEGDDEDQLELEIRQRFNRLRLWQKCAEAYRRSLVGRYGGLILRFADDRMFRDPVENVRGGLEGFVEVIPAWEGQLRVSQWDTDERSETYGQPLMFNFNEAEVDPDHIGRNRSFEVHPDRVVIFSDDGTVHGTPLIQAGYNDLLTLEKITGSSGEGFWKNAKSAPVLQVDKDAQLSEMARLMGVPEDDLVDAMNDQVEVWQKGFDRLLMLQGMEAKTLGVTLPSPQHFRAGALENFAASIECPVKILVGMQTGERASQEDAEEWARTGMARRNDSVIPNVMEFVRRLEMFGVLPERDWWLDWEDLTESGMAEKIDRAHKMADTNSRMQGTGEIVFLPEEIRGALGLAPLATGALYRDEEE